MCFTDITDVKGACGIRRHHVFVTNHMSLFTDSAVESKNSTKIVAIHTPNIPCACSGRSHFAATSTDIVGFLKLTGILVLGPFPVKTCRTETDCLRTELKAHLLKAEEVKHLRLCTWLHCPHSRPLIRLNHLRQ
jgi:hypothetical protein